MNSEEQLRLAILEALHARGVSVNSLNVVIRDDSVTVTGKVTSFHSLQILQRRLQSLVPHHRLVVDVVVCSGDVDMHRVTPPRFELSAWRGRAWSHRPARLELEA